MGVAEWLLLLRLVVSRSCPDGVAFPDEVAGVDIAVVCARVWGVVVAIGPFLVGFAYGLVTWPTVECVELIFDDGMVPLALLDELVEDCEYGLVTGRFDVEAEGVYVDDGVDAALAEGVCNS